MESTEIKRCLKYYGDASGQVINFQKSSIIFGSKVKEEIKQTIKNSLGILNEGGEGSYLGLPECFNGSKVTLMNFIREKLQSRLNGWYAKSLSQGGKEVLLKSVAMSMPVYAMSCFKLHKETCKKITSAMTDFWWSNEKEKRKIPWVAWKKLCRKKEEGGLGFRDIGRFNQALLAKQAWRILEQPSSLLARILKSRYFKNSCILDCGLSSKPSYGWRSILFGRDLLRKGLIRTIGDGRDTKVWHEHWLLDVLPRAPLGEPPQILNQMRVCELMENSTGNWNVPLIRQLFNQRDADLILETRHNVFHRDSSVWGFSASGRYTTQSGYMVADSLLEDEAEEEARPSANIDPILWKRIWKVKTSPKIRRFLWRVLAGAIAVAERLITRGITMDPKCPACGHNPEGIVHVLFTCPRAVEVWEASGILPRRHRFSSSSVSLNFKYILAMSKNVSIPANLRNSIPWIMWYIWKDRNGIIFENIRMSPNLVVEKARDEAQEWFAAQQGNEWRSTNILPSPHVPLSWVPPPLSYTKCNISSSWSDHCHNSGASWILRDHKGTPLFHSRRSYSNLFSAFDAEVHSLFWAFESVSHLRQQYVIFEVQSELLARAIRNPISHPRHREILADIASLLSSHHGWKLIHNPQSCNKAATSLALVVISEQRFHSYVERGNPSWLRNIL